MIWVLLFYPNFYPHVFLLFYFYYHKVVFQWDKKVSIYFLYFIYQHISEGIIALS